MTFVESIQISVETKCGAEECVDFRVISLIPHAPVILLNILTTVCLKKIPTFRLSVTLSNLNQFSKFLHCWKEYKICYENHTIKVWQSYREFKGGNFFETQCSVLYSESDYEIALIVARVESLKDRREMLMARLFKKQVLASNASLHYLLPEPCDNDTIRSLRNSQPFPSIRACTTKFHKSFLSYCLKNFTGALSLCTVFCCFNVSCIIQHWAAMCNKLFHQGLCN